jgi:hypothetical protein
MFAYGDGETPLLQAGFGTIDPLRINGAGGRYNTDMSHLAAKVQKKMYIRKYSARKWVFFEYFCAKTMKNKKNGKNISVYLDSSKKYCTFAAKFVQCVLSFVRIGQVWNIYISGLLLI